MFVFMHLVLIYTQKVTGGKAFVTTLRRLAKKELQTWKLVTSQPVTLAHSQRPGVQVVVALAGTGRFRTAVRGFRLIPEPAAVAVVSGTNADQVLGFLIGMLARRASTLGIASISIPMVEKQG
jgi:hypothetical protein